MADICDIASKTSELFDGIAMAHRKNLSSNGNESAPICCQCGEPIPLERQRAIKGVCLCVDCQEEKERNNA